MGTLRAALLGFVVVLLVGAAPSLAGTTSPATCRAEGPGADGICGASKNAPAAVTTLLPGSQPGTYRLEVTIAKGGTSKAPVRWTPPGDITIKAITSTENGRCSLARATLACVVAEPGRRIAVSFGTKTRPGDAPTIVTFLDIPRGLFRISAPIPSRLGTDGAYAWAPPLGMTINEITRVRGGRCVLAGGSISCHRVAQVGRLCCEMTIDFLADGVRPSDGRWSFYGVGSVPLQILTMTPVPSHGGPSLAPPEEPDVPLCKAGRVSTAAKPCTKD